MPIKEINIKNFKTFTNYQNLKLAPITLLYGENSSGKSTIIKSLDLLSSIFQNYGENLFTQNQGKWSMLNDVKKNLSSERIHNLSSFVNKKPIELGLKISLPYNNDLLRYKNLKKETYYREDVIVNPKNKSLDDLLEDDEIIFKTKKIFTEHTNLSLDLIIKHFDNLHEEGKTSKVYKIEIKDNEGSIISYTRLNKKYNFVKDKEVAGYVSDAIKKNLRNDKINDYFSSVYGYGDYKVNVSKNSRFIKNLFQDYHQIFNQKFENNFKKIFKIISLYKSFAINKIFLMRDSSVEESARKLKCFYDFIAKIYLSDQKLKKWIGQKIIENNNEKKSWEKILELSFDTIKDLSLKVSNDILKSSKDGKSIILFADLISNIPTEQIYEIEKIMKKKFSQKKFTKIIQDDFNKGFVRFTYYNNTYPTFFSKKAEKNFNIYNEDFLKKNKLKLFSSFTKNSLSLFDNFSQLRYFIITNFRQIISDKNSFGHSLHTQLTSSSPNSVLEACLYEIYCVIRGFKPCSPSITEASFNTYTKTELENVRNKGGLQNTHRDLPANKLDLLVEAQNYFKDKPKNEIFDPEKYRKKKKSPDDIESTGNYFESVIINNAKLKRELNKILRKFFKLELVVINLNYLKGFSEKDKKFIRAFISKDFKLHNFSEKFIMVRDLNFKNSFNIHGLEIGKGPMNILPFVVQLLNKRVNLTFAIQELENNWHPKYHAKLIDLLISILKNSKKKTFLMETHSELFILRLQKLVQKGLIDPELISINYISRSKDGISEIHNLPLDKIGSFTKPWPGGFFNERLEILNS